MPFSVTLRNRRHLFSYLQVIRITFVHPDPLQFSHGFNVILLAHTPEASAVGLAVTSDGGFQEHGIGWSVVEQTFLRTPVILTMPEGLQSHSLGSGRVSLK